MANAAVSTPRASSSLRWLAGALCGLALVTGGVGSGAGPLATPSAMAEDALAKAKSEYEAGRRLFDAGDYRGAIAAYARAEAASPSAFNDFNIGLCYDKLGEAEVGVQYYKSFLAKLPAATNRATVEASIARLQAAVDAAKLKAEEARKAEAARAAEAARLAEEARIAEAARAAEAARVAEEARQAEAARLAAAGQPIDPTTGPTTGPTTAPVGPSPLVGGDPARPTGSGDPELDRVAAIDIASARTQAGFMGSTRQPNGQMAATNPSGTGDPAMGTPGPAPVGEPAAPTTPQAKPFYKQWWFWVVAGVSAYVLISIASSDSGNTGNARQVVGPQPARNLGATLLSF